jgi:hypothetical protein
MSFPSACRQFEIQLNCAVVGIADFKLEGIERIAFGRHTKIGAA